MTDLLFRSKPRPALPRLMTARWLRDHGACSDHRQLFAAEWPEGVAASREALTRASQIGLDLGWLAAAVLPPTVYRKLRVKTGPIYDAYYVAEIAALEADLQAKIAALDYNNQFDAVYADFAAKRAPLYAVYKAKIAPLLIDALWTRYEQKGRAK